METEAHNLVERDDRCPKCGERDADMLIVTATEHICCTACGTHYKPGAAAPMTRDDLVRLLDRLDCTIARESGTYDAARCDAIKAQIKAMDDAADAEFAAEWTLETTRTRRAEWNATIKALSETHKGLRFAVAVSAHAKAVGYGTDDLRRAVKMHGL